MPIDILPMGMDISKHKLIKEADIICIHWTNGDFLSVREIKKLIATGKKIYQFCHDNYTFTGGCHVRMGCMSFLNGCKECEQIKGSRAQTYIQKVVLKKKECYEAVNVTIVSPSRWMDKNVSESMVFNGCRHIVIPNVTDTEIFRFCPDEQDDSCYTILCGIKANEKIPYNGMKYLWDVLEKINFEFKEGRYNKKLRIRAFGVTELNNPKEFDIENVGYLGSDEELRRFYSSGDIYIITSLEDSFNQTAAECMACGTPVLAFDNGGISDIIDHETNGYLAKLGDESDMMKGFHWMMEKISEGYIFETRKKIQENLGYKTILRKISEEFETN